VLMVHMNNGDIRAISISEKRGQLKTEVPEARLISGHGIENDGHAGNWERQVTCLDWARVEKANEEHGLDAGPGDFAENIGTRLRLGASAILEVAQIGKEDHPSVVREKFGISLLPKEGLFCKVLEGGSIRKGDPVEVLTRR
jgi:MOSC domain-containing protein YiiM